MDNFIVALNDHWPLFTAVIGIVSSAVTWAVSQKYSNKSQDAAIVNLNNGCNGFNKRLCLLEANNVEFEKYQMYAKNNRERIEQLERSDRLRAETLGLINTKLAGIETDCKWLRETLATNSQKK